MSTKALLNLPVYAGGQRTNSALHDRFWYFFNPLTVGALALWLFLWGTASVLKSLSTTYIARYMELGAELPGPTLMLINASSFPLWVGLAGFLLAWALSIIVSHYWLKQPKPWKRLWWFAPMCFFGILYLFFFIIIPFYLPYFNVPKLIQ